MLKLGEKIISDIYLGDKKIAKVFLGDKLVFQAGKPLFLDYIEFDGASWIDTGLIAKNGLSVKLDYQLTKNNITQQLFGGRSATDKRFGVASVITGDGTHYDLCVLTDNYGSYLKCDLLRHTLEFNSDNSGASLSVDNNVFVTTTNVNNQEINLFLGANNYTNKIPAYMRVYSCEMYENGVLVRDFKPCLDPKGVVCFYDTVTKKYFYNQGTGTLKAGGRFVESILFDGNSYIDTGIIPTNETGAYVRLSRANEDDMVILGSRQKTGTNTRFFPCASAWGGVSCGWDTYRYITNDGKFSSTATTLKIDRNLFYEQYTNYLNNRVLRVIEKTSNLDITSVELGNLTFTPNFPMFLGCANIAGTLSAMFKGNISQCTITKGNTIAQDLRPYVDENGVACFKDLVTNTLFYNQGTGTLTYTEVK